jgi:hypothetical protein
MERRNSARIIHPLCPWRHCERNTFRPGTRPKEKTVKIPILNKNCQKALCIVEREGEASILTLRFLLASTRPRLRRFFDFFVLQFFTQSQIFWASEFFEPLNASKDKSKASQSQCLSLRSPLSSYNANQKLTVFSGRATMAA